MSDTSWVGPKTPIGRDAVLWRHLVAGKAKTSHALARGEDHSSHSQTAICGQVPHWANPSHRRWSVGEDPRSSQCQRCVRLLQPEVVTGG